jgi:putative transcriptional regulator
MSTRDRIRNHLRHHRLLAGAMTQQELARRAGVSRQTIISIERGRYNPSVGLALRLAAIFSVTVELLFELDRGEDDAQASHAS